MLGMILIRFSKEEFLKQVPHSNELKDSKCNYMKTENSINQRQHKVNWKTMHSGILDCPGKIGNIWIKSRILLIVTYINAGFFVLANAPW